MSEKLSCIEINLNIADLDLKKTVLFDSEDSLYACLEELLKYCSDKIDVYKTIANDIDKRKYLLNTFTVEGSGALMSSMGTLVFCKREIISSSSVFISHLENRAKDRIRTKLSDFEKAFMSKNIETDFFEQSK